MLIVTFHNINEKDGVADYDVQISVNQRRIAERKIRGHHRDTGWQGLVLDLAMCLKKGRDVKKSNSTEFKK